MKDKENQINRTDNFVELSDTVSIHNKEKTISVSKFKDIKLTIPRKKEIEEKQIEEIAKWLDELWVDYPPTPTEVAEALIKNDIVKLPKDSVVLSGEEYELYEVVKKGYPNDMTCLVEKFTEISHNSYTKGSKETAEKIWLQSKAIVEATKHLVQGREYLHIDALKEIVKSLGVEIKD